MKALLALEDGTVCEGTSIGAKGTTFGELVFNTSMTGYQEIYTDPSYAGQIVMLTYPLIGNYGSNEADMESFKSHVRGVAVRELCPAPNSWRSKFTLQGFLRRQNIVGIAGVDTRSLTLRIRSHGTMRSGLSTELSPAELLEAVEKSEDIGTLDLVSEVTTATPFKFLHPLEPDGGELDRRAVPRKPLRGTLRGTLRVSVLDCGVKYNIPRSLMRRGCCVDILPARTTPGQILENPPHALVISNGPGDPKVAAYAINTARNLLGKIPIMGICLGHQILALALGADTYKMKFGHRGANQPVKDLVRGKVVVTSQNHGYAVSEEGLDRLGIRVSMINVNDGTIEGIVHDEYPLLSVQFHPEASPGPVDSKYLFDEFLEMAEKRRNRVA
ncbi:MAG: glutamine-hydrolyzing carbamoyl-phosphate synthase small subunit [bacterium]